MSLGTIVSFEIDNPSGKGRPAGAGPWLVERTREVPRPDAPGSRVDRRLPFAQQWLRMSPHGGDAA